jgi:adenylate kinase
LLPASHVTAGGLIRENVGNATVTVGTGNKAVPNADANQVLLLRGLELYRARVDSKPILLDGHFSLLNAKGEVVAIPVAVYESLAPVAVVLIEADVETVRKRRVERDGDAPPLKTISLLSARERESADAVCEALGIRIIKARGDGDAEQAAGRAASALREVLECTA